MLSCCHLKSLLIFLKTKGKYFLLILCPGKYVAPPEYSLSRDLQKFLLILLFLTLSKDILLEPTECQWVTHGILYAYIRMNEYYWKKLSNLAALSHPNSWFPVLNTVHNPAFCSLLSPLFPKTAVSPVSLEAYYLPSHL